MSEAARPPDLREEGRRVIAAANEREVPLRLTGGVAVALRCPSAAHPPLAREYKDIDLVGLSSARRQAVALLRDLGYGPDEEFNALHGRTRLMFYDPYGRQLDVILDQLEMSHVLELKQRLLLDPETLTTADLLLTKLQVVEVNERDLKDASALLHDHGIDRDRVAEVAGADWGWWRTMTNTLDHVSSWCSSLPGFEEGSRRITRQIDDIRRRIDEQPKSMRWKVRAKVGERVRWYELPEEVEQ
jgi:hypothetical protein